MISNEDAERVKSKYKATLSGPNGDEMLDDLIKAYVLTQNPYKDAVQMARFEGRRDIVILLLNMVRDNPDQAVDKIARANISAGRKEE